MSFVLCSVWIYLGREAEHHFRARNADELSITIAFPVAMSLAYCFAKSPDTAMSTKSRFLFSHGKILLRFFSKWSMKYFSGNCVHWRKGAVSERGNFRLWSTKIISCPTAPVHPTIPTENDMLRRKIRGENTVLRFEEARKYQS